MTRVFDSSTAGWIADLIISGEIANYEASIGALWDYEAIQDASILNINIGTGFLKESSLGSDFVWDNGVLDVSIISTDASVQDLYNYVEDLSAYTYSHTHAQDSSIEELFNEIENLPQDASIIDLYNYTLDLSTRLDNFDPAQDASIGELFVYVEDLSTYTYSHTHAQDSSIDDLYSVKADKSYVDGSLNTKVNQALFDTSIASLTGWNLSQDASIVDLYSVKADKTEIYSKSYIDGSLNAKQPLGNYVKEASLGEGLVWVNGLLDVSVEGGSSSQDASITDLYNYTLDLSTRLDNFDPSQDASISDLYSKKADKTEIYSKSYIDGSLNKKATFNPLSTAGWFAKFEGNNGRIGPSFHIKETAAGLQMEGVFQQPIEESSFKNVLVSSYLGILRYRTDLVFEASLNDYATSIYVDGSLNTKVNQALFDTSIASLTGWNLSQDASLLLKADKTYVDGSLGNYYNKTQIDASLGAIYTKTQIDSSFGLITNLAKSPFQTLTLANAGDSSIAWYVRNGWNAKYTLTKDVSLMIPDVSHGDSGTLLLIEDASGTWKMNLPANSFILSDASTITKTAGAKNFLTFVYDISTFYWNLGKNYIAKSQV